MRERSAQPARELGARAHAELRVDVGQVAGHRPLAEEERARHLAIRPALRDQGGRDHMKKYDGIEAGFDNVANYLRSLVDQKAPAAG